MAEIVGIVEISASLFNTLIRNSDPRRTLIERILSIGNEVPGNRLPVRAPCPPLASNAESRNSGTLIFTYPR